MQRASDWKTLRFPENVRKRSGMYIGENDGHGIFQLLKEPIDNSNDEFLAKRNKYIHVHIESKVFYIQDYGGGIPIEVTKALGKSPLEAAFNELHSGGKFEGKAYSQGSAGCNGVGCAVTAALSSKLIVYTKRGRSWYSYSATKGVGSGINRCSVPTLPSAMTTKQGTVVKFSPDMTMFQKGARLDVTHLGSYLETLSYLSGGITIRLTTDNGVDTTYLHKNGTTDYVEETTDLLGLERSDIFQVVSGSKEMPTRTDVAFAVTNASDALLDSYVCASICKEGGTHTNAFKRALMAALKPHILKKHSVQADFLMVGLVGIVNYNMIQPQFSSQTKERLTSEEGKELYNDILAPLTKFFASRKSLAREMLDKATAYKKNMDSFKATNKALSGLGGKRTGLPSKLARSHPKTPASDVELILVEGDSAGGTAKNSVDKRYQEVLPLKGKIVAAYKNTLAKLMSSEEVKFIFQSIGYDGKLEDPLKNMRVGKIALLMDADVDGAHIELLVLSALWRLCPQLFEEGKVFLIKGPLYCTQSKPLFWGDTLEEVKGKCKSGQKITRIKGWGEVNPYELNAFAFAEETRRWVKVLPPPNKKDLDYFMKLVGTDATLRRSLLNL